MLGVGQKDVPFLESTIDVIKNHTLIFAVRSNVPETSAKV